MKFVQALFTLAVGSLSCLATSTTYFVAPTGDDRASGIAGHPFKTIQRAADEAKAGDTVSIDDGLYREAVLVKNSGTDTKPIRFTASHPGMVTISGADPIFDWTRLPGSAPIYFVPWNHVFAIDWKGGEPIEHHPDDAPLWGRAEQVFSDGRQLLPTLNLADLNTAWAQKGDNSRIAPPLKGLGAPFVGQFAVDTAAKRLYVWLANGSDPNRRQMLGSTRGQTFGVNPWQKADGVSYVQVKGIRFLFGASFPQRPAVCLFGAHNLVEDCLIEQMAGTGVGVSGVLRNCVIRGCGHTGGSANGDGFANENDVWIGNSWKPIDRGWEAGGVKIAASKNGLFKHCVFRRNGGPGLWLDVWVHDVQITNCIFEENEGCGLFVEISHHIQADHNLAVRNALGDLGNPPGWSDGGMVMAESEDCAFRYNTCVGNRYGIGFREQGPRENDTDTGHIAFHNARDAIDHNLLAGNRLCQLGIWFDNPFFGRHPSDTAKYATEEAFSEYLKTIPDKVYDPTKQRLGIDGNVYQAPTVGSKDVQYGVPWRPRAKQFDKVAELAKATGFELKANSAPAGWQEAPADTDTWMKQKLSSWLRTTL